MKVAIGGIRGLPANYGGFETSAEETTKRMIESGLQVTIYCRKRGKGKDYLKSYLGAKFIYLPCIADSKFETISHSFAIAFHALVNKNKFNVLHLYNAASCLALPILKIVNIYH